MKKMSSVEVLEHFDKETLARKKSRINKYFKFIVRVCIFIEILTIIPFLICFYFYIDTGLFWTLIPKFIQIIRIILLIAVHFSKIDVYWLRAFKPKYNFMLIKVWRYYPQLGAWLLIGYIDLFLFRFSVFIVDLILFIVTDSFITTQCLVYFMIDALYLIEFYLTFYLLYNIGVIKNMIRHLNRSRFTK
jgi:hypothetical protein